jgi:hypothetical protein
VEVPVSNEGKEIKITDRRIFTPDGQLREEYRFLDEKSTAAEAPAEAPEAAAGAASAPAAGAVQGAAGGGAGGDRGRRAGAPPPAPAAAGGPAGGPPAGSPSGGGAAWEGAYAPQPPQAQHGAGEYSSARLELPGTPPGLGPSFFDLAAMLAEPIPIYLGDVDLPDGQSAENLEMARLYIDLLDVLRQKTAGNLTAQESAFLEDLLYRLRVRYVQKSR